MRKIYIILLLFVTYNFSYGCKSSDKSSELVTAASSGQLKQVERLVDDGVPVDAKANDDWTPLTAASREGHFSVVKYLLDHKADINKPEGGGNTALFWAAYAGNLNIVKLLMERGANPLKRCFNCSAPFDIAVTRGHKDVANYLMNSISKK